MLRTRLFKFFAVLVIIFAILSAFIGVRMIYQQVIKEAQTRVRLNLSSAWAVVDARMDEIETVMKLLAGKALVVEACFNRDWPNQELQNRLELIRMNLGLDFLTIVSPMGQVVVRAAPPYRTQDFRLSSPPVMRALEGQAVSGMALMAKRELEWEQEGLAEDAYMVLEDTPHARPSPRRDETRGMVMMAAAPVEKGNLILGAIYGGVLLNRKHSIVDHIQDIVFKNEKYDGAPAGTVTVFLNDIRVATTVRLPNGNRAIGTQVSKEVFDRVLENGLRWEGRAFVVNDWYLTAYEPVRDLQGKIIGMLYVGLLEQPFKDLVRNLIYRYAFLSLFILTIAVILAFFLANRLAKPLHLLAQAAEKMRRGESPPTVKAPNASRETQALIDAFNTMAATLTEREAHLKEAKDQLEETNLSLQTLNRSYMEAVGFISHELKSPLATIMNYTYLIGEQKMGPLTEKQAKAVNNIDNNVKLIVEMVRHYLNLSRIENGELDPIQTRVELLTEVLAPLSESLEGRLQERQMRFVNQVDDQVVLWTDLNMTREVFENLLSNAVKYGREGGEIRIACVMDGNFQRFSVFNEGEGVPPEKIDTLFKKFSRLEGEGATRKKKGTGLGLFITKNIVEAHGGSIQVTSQYHEWVQFEFTLPRYQDQKSREAQKET